MQVDTLEQRLVQPQHGGVLGDVLGWQCRQMRDALTIEDVAVGTGDGLAGQQPLDALKDGVAAGGELQLQQLLDCRGPHRAPHQSRLQQRLGLRGERQTALDRGGVKRFDAERVARQGDGAAHALMDGDGVHAAQMARIVRAVAQPQMERRLTVAVGGETGPRHALTQLAGSCRFRRSPPGWRGRRTAADRRLPGR